MIADLIIGASLAEDCEYIHLRNFHCYCSILFVVTPQYMYHSMKILYHCTQILLHHQLLMHSMYLHMYIHAYFMLNFSKIMIQAK